MELEVIIEKIPDNKKKLNKIIEANKNIVKQYKREIQDLKYKESSILNKKNLAYIPSKSKKKKTELNLLKNNNYNTDDEDIALFINKNNEKKDFLMLSEENRELKKDFYSAASKIGGWFGYVGSSIKNAANAATEYTGLDKKIDAAKSSISEGLEKIGLKKPIEKTGETVGTVVSKTAEAVGNVGGKTIDKVSEIGIVNK